jgi:hypothetical protein
MSQEAMTLSRDPIERTVQVGKFLRKVTLPLRDPTACWPWHGPHRPRCAASYYWSKHAGTTAARYAWMITYDEVVPRGTLLLRTCRNSACVNPAHARRYKSREVAAEVRRLLAAGWKQKDVAAQVGIPLGSVGRLALGMRARRAA